MSVIAVVGATGTIGSRLVGRLAAGDHEVRAIARDPGEFAKGVEPFAADLTDSDQAVAALEGATRVYLTPPEAGDDPLASIKTLLSQRASAYAKAHYTVETDELTPRQVAEKVLELCREWDSPKEKTP